MKIVCLSLGRNGGCVKYSYEIMRRMSSVESICSSFSNEVIDFKAIKIPTFVGKYTFLLSSIFALPLFMTLFVFLIFFRKYKVLYIPYFHHWNIFFIYIAAFFKLKIIITEHDGVLHNGDADYGEQWMRKLCMRKATHLIFLSHHVKNLVLKKFHFSKTYYSVVPHGIFQSCEVGCEELIASRSNPGEALSLLFLGRISKYKGVELLLEAVSEMPHNIVGKVVIAGKSNYKIESRFVGDSRVLLIDKFLSEDEMTQFLMKTDLLILPYTEASQSGVIGMGIDFCLPMIISDVGGLQEQLSSTEALFVKPTVSSLKCAIEFLYSNYSERTVLSTRLDKLKGELTWDNISMDIERILLSYAS